MKRSEEYRAGFIAGKMAERRRKPVCASTGDPNAGRYCSHGYTSGHSSMCPGGGRNGTCEHGFSAGHESMCPGGPGY